MDGLGRDQCDETDQILCDANLFHTWSWGRSNSKEQLEKMTTSTFFSTSEDAANMHRFYDSTFLPQIEAILAPMELPDYVIGHVKQLLDYNIKGGKMLRGKMVCAFTRALVGHDWSQVAQKAYLLAWCIELLQAFFLIADDIMDSAVTRRNKPCWYKVVGMTAINDSFLMSSLIFALFLIQLCK